MSTPMERLNKYAIFYFMTLLILAILNVTIFILQEVKNVNESVTYVYNQLTQAEICEN